MENIPCGGSRSVGQQPRQRSLILLADTIGSLSAGLAGLGDLIDCRNRSQLSTALRGLLGGEATIDVLVIEEALLGPRRLEILEALHYAGLPCPVFLLGDESVPPNRIEQRAGVRARFSRATKPAQVTEAIARQLERDEARRPLAPPRSGVFRCGHLPGAEALSDEPAA